MPHSTPILSQAPAFAETSSERARMGRISGVLWIAASLASAAASLLPGAQGVGTGWVMGFSAAIFLYGVGTLTGAIGWERASMNSLGVGMVATIPVVGLAIYVSGGAVSYVEPLLVGLLLYAAFFFPTRWAWPLVAELILVSATPLLYDPASAASAFPSRCLTLAVAYIGATWVMAGLKRRLVAAEVLQRDFANRDPLTGVGNRRFFDATLHRELAARTEPRGRRRPDDSPLALLLVDLDDFKGVNDMHGHQAGDAVLRHAAARVQAMLRSTDVIARIGGDEFAIVAPGAQGEGAEQMAESIRAAVSRADAGDPAPAPSASIGWAVFPEDGRDFETLMRAADERMLSRKRGGRRTALAAVPGPSLGPV